MLYPIGIQSFEKIRQGGFVASDRREHGVPESRPSALPERLLTIRGIDPRFSLYTLGFPNLEVKDGFLNFLLGYYAPVKTDSTPDEGLAQIEERGYARPFADDPRKIFRIGVNFSTANHRIDGWKVVR